MDEFDLCDLSDASRIAEILLADRGVLFGYQNDNVTTFSVFIGPPAMTLGRLPYGGQSFGRYIVGVIYLGLYHFTLDEGPLHATYVGEKLRLEHKDAEAITKMLNAVREQLIEQTADHSETPGRDQDGKTTKTDLSR